MTQRWSRATQCLEYARDDVDEDEDGFDEGSHHSQGERRQPGSLGWRRLGVCLHGWCEESEKAPGSRELCSTQGIYDLEGKRIQELQRTTPFLV